MEKEERKAGQRREGRRTKFLARHGWDFATGLPLRACDIYFFITLSSNYPTSLGDVILGHKLQTSLENIPRKAKMIVN